MMEWRPIETAPRDGEPILVANSRLPDHAPVVVRWLDEMSNPDTGWCDAATASGDALYFNARYFDYWMPVPAVPSFNERMRDPMKYLIALAVIFGNAALLWAGVHFGSKWVDKMLHYEPIDPSKPIVLPHPFDRQ